MLKKSSWILMVICTMAFAMGCGDDEKKTTTSKDGGSKRDGQSIVTNDGTNTVGDTSVNPIDGPAASDATASDGTVKGDASEKAHCTPVTAATVNSGKLVTDCSECDKKEVCLTYQSGKKQCLGGCCNNPEKADDPANTCLVADATKQYSECKSVKFSDGYPGVDICYWRCGTVTVGDKTIDAKCPNETDFECKAIFTGKTDTYCVPKAS